MRCHGKMVKDSSNKIVRSEWVQMSGQPFELRYDKRLQIETPHLHVPIDHLTEAEREAFEVVCQQVCSNIPVQIQTFEKSYMERFALLEEVEEDEDFFDLLDEMNEISSCINDLNVLFLHIEGRFLASRAHA